MTECSGWLDENNHRHACPKGRHGVQCWQCQTRERTARWTRNRRQRDLERTVTWNIEEKRFTKPADPFAGFRGED